jgi:anti-anti-sigma factor
MTVLGERLAGSDEHELRVSGAMDDLASQGFHLREQQDHSIDLTLRTGSALVRLAGDIDMVAAEDLSRLLTSLDRLTTIDIHIDLAEVRFFDSSGLQPLIEATRRRRAWQLPPVLIGECSTAVLRLLSILGVAANRVLDVDVWDQLATPPPGKVAGT